MFIKFLKLPELCKKEFPYKQYFLTDDDNAFQNEYFLACLHIVTI